MITRDKALELFRKYNKSESLYHHALKLLSFSENTIKVRVFTIMHCAWKP